jgi:uncharacterized tellurite resistance protein B-like protein
MTPSTLDALLPDIREAIVDGLRELLYGSSSAMPKGSPDHRVLAHVLYDIATADGQIRSAEQSIIDHFVAPELGPLAELAPLAAPDLMSTSPPVREAIFKIAWVMALADSHLAEAERACLLDYAVALHIPKERAEALRGAAEDFIAEAMKNHMEG